MKLAVHITRRQELYRATCPALPGCVVHAETLDAAKDRIGQAVRGYLASLEVALPRELGRCLDTQMVAGAA